jgi:hypothetical protein
LGSVFLLLLPLNSAPDAAKPIEISLPYFGPPEADRTIWMAPWGFFQDLFFDSMAMETSWIITLSMKSERKKI